MTEAEITIAKAQAAAEKLRSLGVEVEKVIEPTADMHGRLVINSRIYVEVPLESPYYRVALIHSSSDTHWGRPRKRLTDVKLDISCCVYQNTPQR